MILLITSCGSSRNLEFDSIDGIGIRYNETKPIVFNSVLNLKFFATVGDKQIDVSNRETFNVTTPNGMYYDKSTKQLVIDRYANSFDENELEVFVSYANPENLSELVQEKFTFQFRFDQPMVIDYSGENVKKGGDGLTRNTRLIGRDGVHGENGMSGSHGADARPIEVYLWREEAFLYAVSIDLLSGEKRFHKTINQENVKVLANGGRGGDGGNGANGGDGGKGVASSRKFPGNAGNGGNGGDGGNGGNGAEIIIYFHDPSAVDLLPNVRINNSAGIGGAAGRGGLRGKVGSPDAGQRQANNGSNGINGLDGITGQSGASPVIQALEFDIEAIQL
ncbi:MAG: hypothetical protein ACPGU5_04450 [Lishizhenia sp.]